MEAALGEADRDGRRARRGGRRAVGGGVELGVGHRAVDQSPLGGLRAAELAPSSSSSLARATPTRRGSSQVAPLSGLKPALGGTAPRSGRLGRDGEVGGERELAAEPGGPAAHRAHHRQLDLGDQLDQPVRLQRRAPLEAAGARPGSPALGRLVATQSAPGAEVGAGAGDETARRESSVAAVLERARRCVRTAAGSSAFFCAGRSSGSAGRRRSASMTTPSGWVAVAQARPPVRRSRRARAACEVGGAEGAGRAPRPA